MKKTFIVMTMLLLLVGCADVVEPAPFVPTAAPTVPPTETPTPTITLSPTITLTPTFIPTPTAAAPTQIFGATATPLDTTSTPTRQPGAPEIEFFVTSSSNVAPGDNVTLLWSIQGIEQGLIYRLDDEGEREQFWRVDARGRLVVATHTGDAETARFSLVVGEEAEEIEEVLSIPLTGCSEPWFFEPAPDACAGGPPVSTQAAEQGFERGRMIWVQAEMRIYVLFNDDQQPAWAAYPDTFVEGQTPASDPQYDNPPPNLLQPVRGFGLVWRDNEAVRARLGWATAPELAFDGALQSDSNESTLYLRSATGTILALDAGGDAWTELAP